MNNGDIVLFSTGKDGNKTNIGMIIKHKEDGNYVVLSQYKSAYKNIEVECISTLEQIETVRKEVYGKFITGINELRSKIRRVTSEEKNTERVEKYQELKGEIMTCARRLSESTDDTDFENRLKAISDMRKCIFTIELDCVSDIRKENGRIKYKIRELEKLRDSELNKISDENLQKAFDF